MNLVILGPQGSGKGTQAKLLAEKYGLEHISTGALMRQEIASGSDLGKQLKALIDEGNLATDNMLMAILEKSSLGQGKGFILDGTPRNINQTQALDKLFSRVSLQIDYVIYLDIPYDESVRRMIKRAEIEHRPDDNLIAIKKRLKIFEDETLPVVEHYRQQGKLIEVDGRPDIQTIFQDICNKLDTGVK